MDFKKNVVKLSHDYQDFKWLTLKETCDLGKCGVPGPDPGFASVFTNNITKITYEEYQDLEDEINNCNLILDDIVKPSEFQCKIIQQMLVKNKRHNNINIFALSHQIERNGLHPLMQHFDYVIFTNSVKNTPVFNVYIKKFCPKDEAECKSRWDDFISKQLGPFVSIST